MIIKSHSQNMEGFKIRLSEARARSEGIFADYIKNLNYTLRD